VCAAPNRTEIDLGPRRWDWGMRAGRGGGLVFALLFSIATANINQSSMIFAFIVLQLYLFELFHATLHSATKRRIKILAQ